MRTRRWAVHLAGAAALLAVSGQANAACWAGRSEAGAKVRALQSMLMVGTLRCHAYGLDITPAYNAFVDSKTPALREANAAIKAHIAAAEPFDAERGYDRFTTALANRYGDAATSGEICDGLAALAQAAAAAQGFEGLLRLAEAAAVDPGLPGGRCEDGYSKAATLAEIVSGLGADPGTR